MGVYSEARYNRYLYGGLQQSETWNVQQDSLCTMYGTRAIDKQVLDSGYVQGLYAQAFFCLYGDAQALQRAVCVRRVNEWRASVVGEKVSRKGREIIRPCVRVPLASRSIEFEHHDGPTPRLLRRA